MKSRTILAICLIAVTANVNLLAAPNDIRNEPRSGIKDASSDDARCKKDVVRYIETVQFLRQSAGEQVSAKVMSSYVPIEQLNQVVSRNGLCAGAQLLRDKKAPR